MLRQNGGSNKRGLGFARFSNSNFFTLSNSGSWGMGRHIKSNSLSSISSNLDCYDSPIVDPEHIMQLVNDVRKFADVLFNLKESFLSEENQVCLHQVVHERLGELLRLLKTFISKHQTLNSVDILSAAGTLIAKMKGVNFKEVNEENKREQFSEIFLSVDTLAFTFGNVVSDFLMGDVDSGSALGLPLSQRSRSFENIVVESRGSVHERDDIQSTEHLRAEEVDNMLLRNDSGIEAALTYAKAWSKYTKDVLAWVEKRLSLEVECARNFAKMAESAKAVVGQQVHMPFRSIYVSAFVNDIEYNQLILKTAAALQTNKFMQPLLGRRNELDKHRKEIKEHWQREQKKMQEAETAVRKAKLMYIQRQEDYERAKSSTLRAEEENISSSGGVVKDAVKLLEKRRRLEEEAMQKAEEASEHYKACMADVSEKRTGLENIKSEILAQLRELVYQCDLTLKAATVNLFQLQHAQVVSLPVNFQSLCESAKLYEPGQQYSEFVKNLPKEDGLAESFSFEAQNAGLPLHKKTSNSAHSSHGNLSQASGTSGEFPTQSADDVGSLDNCKYEKSGQKRSNSTDIQALRGQGTYKAWPSGSQGCGMCSDSESAGGSSESRSMDSPSASPVDFKRRIPRTPSTGTMSSADDLDEREPPSPSDNVLGLAEIASEVTSSPGPFRNAMMSKAAQTHKLRKLRAPSKCRECDSLVVFHGAECEECSLACHKKCLETLAIQCGHKKLQGRLHLFGVDFAQAAKNAPDGIPFIIKKCTSEIESRALNAKGIYRVNGAKSRVEKLCQVFENGKDLVELSDLYAHDISNVLKLYLRQLPEPLILFRLYNDFIGLAKESRRIYEEIESKQNCSAAKKRYSWNIELNRIIFKMRDLLKQLPQPNYNTLQYLLRHLQRITEKEEENKMSASNLGIIFGPTLIRPRQTDAAVSLSSLVDYPYQARVVELFIVHCEKIFDISFNSLASTPAEGNSPVEVNVRSISLSAEEKDQEQNRKSQPFSGGKEAIQLSKSEEAATFKEQNEAKGMKQILDSSSVTNYTVDQKSDEIEVPISSPGCEDSEIAHDSCFIKVQMRPPRAKPVIRPVSLPADRIGNPCFLNEKNSKNLGSSNPGKMSRSPTIEEVLETKTHSTASTYRYSCYDTQFLRRTWDRQYKSYDMTPRTAMIMANVSQENRAHDGGNASGLQSCYNYGNSSGNAILPNKPYTVSVRPVRAMVTEGITPDSSFSAIFRAPRTLQPPPGTFYKPPSTSQPKQSEDSLVKTCVTMVNSTVTVHENSEVVSSLTNPESLSNLPRQDLNKNVSSEGLHQIEAKPPYPRMRPKRMQEIEHREAHFV
ncbi:rho GTPase-activating protein 29 isoform X3 [Latimeria chalumnae]|nr:PREDICTED: rho GTPase-activating protein 29 isoform X3 [Latimeria chalumnae]XP_006005666.1 PREDICTED: rho GTPase-activating protein 29 isoform X3 [Latimeria chalumnae]XP_006005667.1 PREDICTED: rho GTPase-activating protein 29 isoform X3 [Latimeria chalumnae]XP_014349742.1 PREDICTED: rho GTPase-activating protein 29 isoform X3 [Latimeria chalumnae]|eukprot:XP_006005665.1 PREDICTED: rho GTPase-activating protein 29 isoform X3 [Latimeria chalumnae]